MFIVAYDVLENNCKFTKRMPLANGLDFLSRNDYNLDKIAAALRVSRRLGRVFIIWGDEDQQHSYINPNDFASMNPHS